MASGNHRGAANGGFSAGLDMGTADIHLKMCKKVAQLTKVIYVLNTRLDENDSIVAQLRADHEKELEVVRTETSDKLRLYKNIVEQLSAAERKNSELDECLQLQKRHEVEALARFESFKREAAERERNLRDGYAGRVLELGSEVLKIKHQLEEKINELNKLSTERTMDKDKLNSAEELERRFKDELSKLRDRNHQLQTSMDKMKDDYLSQLNSAQSEFESKESTLKDDMQTLETELTKLRSAATEQQKNNQSALIENHKKEVSGLHDEIDKLKKSLVSQENQYQIRINDLVQRLASSDSQVEELRSEIRRQTEMLNTKSSDTSSLSKQLMEASAKTNSLIEETRRLEGELSKMSKRCSELSREILQKQDDLSASESTRLQTETLCTDLRRDLDATKKSLQAAEARIKEFSLSSSEIETKLKARLTDTESELAVMRRDNGRLTAELGNQRQQLTDEQTRKLSEMKATHENQLLVLQSRHEEELTRERLSSEEKLSKLSRDLLGSADSLRSQFDAEKALLCLNYDREIDDLRKELAARQAALASLEETSKSLSHELSAVKRQQEAATGEAKDAVWSLSEAKRRISTLEEHAKIIEAENADLKTKHPLEIEKLTTQHRLDMETAVRDVETTWAEKLRSELGAVRRTLLGESEQKYQNSIDEMQRQKEAELQALKDGWTKKTNDLLKDLSDMRQQLTTAEARVVSETARLRTDYDDQIGRLRDEMQSQADKFNEQIKSMRREAEEESAWLMAEKEKAVKEAEARFKNEQLEAMQAQAVAHRTVAESMNRQHEMEKTRALEEAARQHSFELAEIRDSVAKKHLAELEQASRFHESQMSAVRQELEKVVELTRKQERDYEGRLEDLRRQVKQRDQRVIALEEGVATWEQKANMLVNQLDTARHEALRIRDQMVSEMRQREDEAVANIERELEQARRDSRFQQQAMVEEFSKVQQLLKEKIGALQELNTELEERYRQRESRDEDLALIEELKERLRIKATELNQITNEKRSLEMELVNRERNFNKIFSNNPQVGVIDPLSAMKKRPSVDGATSKFSRTHSGGSAGDTSIITGSVAPVRGNNNNYNSNNSKPPQNGKSAQQPAAVHQAWGTAFVQQAGSTQRLLDPLPNSPIHDEQLNPLKPLPPAPKVSTRI